MTERELNVLFIMSWPLFGIGLLALRYWIVRYYQRWRRHQHRSA